MTLVRCSICILFIRIFFTRTFSKLRHVSPSHYAPAPTATPTTLECLLTSISAYVALGLSIGWCFFVIISAGVICTPFEYNWDKSIIAGRCGNEKGTYIAIASWSIALDCLIWILPIPVVWQLQLPQAHRVALIAVFGLGLLDVAASIFRIKTVLQNAFFKDLTYTAIASELWAIAEVSIAIVTACCPLLRPIFEKMVSKRLAKWVESHISTRISMTVSARSGVTITPRPQTQESPEDEMENAEELTTRVVRRMTATGI
ncbi:hypothetical protein K432DRAFT_343140 [Lepidopterella palustris CBS 459.81]|uniref:Rhodopsin domain-containing protein n=1 Tax=Lepidopterella palustris CBS 459.81 TaxID=1314670 RepID=A0A8E2EKC4_9PEZI|nr:hypothetical protein K432DRAFT_343140 [Lepidopterella palustris CBS 459.81]